MPAGALGFSVVVFICVAVTGVIVLLIRRYTVGGELGGSQMGRQVSCVLFCSLWAIYILMSILQVGGKLGEVSIGSMSELEYDVSV